MSEARGVSVWETESEVQVSEKKKRPPTGAFLREEEFLSEKKGRKKHLREGRICGGRGGEGSVQPPMTPFAAEHHERSCCGSEKERRASHRSSAKRFPDSLRDRKKRRRGRRERRDGWRKCIKDRTTTDDEEKIAISPACRS